MFAEIFWHFAPNYGLNVAMISETFSTFIRIITSPVDVKPKLNHMKEIVSYWEFHQRLDYELTNTCFDTCVGIIHTIADLSVNTHYLLNFWLFLYYVGSFLFAFWGRLISVNVILLSNSENFA